jgi:hypothetical protein
MVLLSLSSLTTATPCHSAGGRFCSFRSDDKQHPKGDCIPQDLYLCEGQRSAVARVLVNCGLYEIGWDGVGQDFCNE